MMYTEFYDRFNSLNKDDLFKIITNRQNYQKEALATAIKIIKEKG